MQGPSANAEITVAMVTKNSHSRLGDAFLAVLRAIQEEFKLTEFLLVDDSEDDTVSVVRNVFPSSRVTRGAKTRGVARQVAIEQTRSSWLMFVDDDCLIEKGWLAEARGLMANERVGQIWGPYRKPGQSRPGRNTIRDFWRRGGTHDTMLRREAVSGIRIPYFLNWYEDAFIKRYVESKGFLSAVNTAGCYHLSTGGSVWRKNLDANVENLYDCGRFMGLYRPNLFRAIQIAVTTFSSPSEYRKRYRWFRYFTGLYRYNNPRQRRVVKSHDGLLWTFRPMMHDTLAFGRHEAWLRPYFIFKRGEVFLDVGAHVGKYSIRAARAGCTVHSWEPNPENARVLLDNAMLNNVTVDLHQEALGDTDSAAFMIFCGANSFVAESGGGETIRMRRLDSYSFANVNFLKIDAEGSDLRILKGATETLAAHHPRVVVETHGAEYVSEVVRLLSEIGYATSVVGSAQKYVIANFRRMVPRGS